MGKAKRKRNGAAPTKKQGTDKPLGVSAKADPQDVGRLISALQKNTKEGAKVCAELEAVISNKILGIGSNNSNEMGLKRHGEQLEINVKKAKELRASANKILDERSGANEDTSRFIDLAKEVEKNKSQAELSSSVLASRNPPKVPSAKKKAGEHVKLSNDLKEINAVNEPSVQTRSLSEENKSSVTPTLQSSVTIALRGTPPASTPSPITATQSNANLALSGTLISAEPTSLPLNTTNPSTPSLSAIDMTTTSTTGTSSSLSSSTVIPPSPAPAVTPTLPSVEPTANTATTPALSTPMPAPTLPPRPTLLTPPSTQTPTPGLSTTNKTTTSTTGTSSSSSSIPQSPAPAVVTPTLPSVGTTASTMPTTPTLSTPAPTSPPSLNPSPTSTLPPRSTLTPASTQMSTPTPSSLSSNTTNTSTSTSSSVSTAAPASTPTASSFLTPALPSTLRSTPAPSTSSPPESLGQSSSRSSHAPSVSTSSTPAFEPNRETRRKILKALKEKAQSSNGALGCNLRSELFSGNHIGKLIQTSQPSSHSNPVLTYKAKFFETDDGNIHAEIATTSGGNVPSKVDENLKKCLTDVLDVFNAADVPVVNLGGALVKFDTPDERAQTYEILKNAILARGSIPVLPEMSILDSVRFFNEQRMRIDAGKGRGNLEKYIQMIIGNPDLREELKSNMQEKFHDVLDRAYKSAQNGGEEDAPYTLQQIIANKLANDEIDRGLIKRIPAGNKTSRTPATNVNSPVTSAPKSQSGDASKLSWTAAIFGRASEQPTPLSRCATNVTLEGASETPTLVR